MYNFYSTCTVLPTFSAVLPACIKCTWVTPLLLAVMTENPKPCPSFGNSIIANFCLWWVCDNLDWEGEGRGDIRGEDEIGGGEGRGLENWSGDMIDGGGESS